MNMSGMNVILAIVIILVILPVCTQAIHIPHSITGTVYLSDGVAQAPWGTSLNVTDTTNGDYTPGTTGSGPNSGGYAATINGDNGDTVIVNAWNATHYGTTTITLSGAMTGIDVLINIPSADSTPPASVSNLGETDKGTTWILWRWTNPSDSDFSHTEVYVNGVKADVNTPNNSYNAAGLSSGTTYEIGTRTVDNSNNMRTEWINDTATTLSLAAPSTTSSSATGAPIDTYRVDVDVYAAGSGFTTSTNADIYVVRDRGWNDGDLIPSDVTGAVETVSVMNGGVGTVLVWNAPLVVSKYDIVIDANRNGIYDVSTDGLDSGSPGFVVIAGSSPVPVPVLTPPGILCLIGLLCVIGVSRVRRDSN